MAGFQGAAYAQTIGPEIYALLYTMLGAGIGVLLIACVNVSNLLVARLLASFLPARRVTRIDPVTALTSE